MNAKRVRMSALGQKPEVAALRRDVCFAPVSGHRQAVSACPKSAICGSRDRGLTRSNRWCRETGRWVTLEILLCGGPRSTSEPAPDPDVLPISRFPKVAQTPV